MQRVIDDLSRAIRNAKARAPAVVYYDAELDGFGVYEKEDLSGAGSWVRRDMIMHDTDLTDERNEQVRKGRGNAKSV
jgi:hypothetical protein